MIPETAQALTILGIAVAPGYVALTAWSRSKTWKGQQGDLRTILQAIVLSAVVQIAALPLTLTLLFPFRDDLTAHPSRVAVWLVATVVVIPLAGGVAFGALVDWVSRIEKGSPSRWRALVARPWLLPSPPSVWDWLFTTRPPNEKFLILEMSDGSRVAGVFAQGSNAFTSPEPHGLFLETEWLTDGDGNITIERPDSLGVLIPDLSKVRYARILEEGE